ncbi:MAG: right-handed parallel beta-helix repeat-containing protein, partial [Myxococcota bacterium]|nr:right-handed parallel beta-helix repeat-containing protein [Myxococcota bacterium]
MRFSGFSTGIWLSGENNVLGRQWWAGDWNNETSDCGTGVAVEGDHNTINGGHFDNNTVGILLDGAVGTAIRGAWSTLRCHDNTDVGILIAAGSDQTRIDNASIRGNGVQGIWVQDSSDVRVRSGVYVWDNGGDGIGVTGDSQNVRATDVYTFGNNGGLAFNLVHEQDDEWGVTPNDGGDDDTGPNGLLNYPVIEQAYRLNANEIYVQGTACAGCRVVFRSADDDPSGHGEGQSKAATFYTDEGGFYEGTLSLGSQIHLITAMASTDVWTEEEWDAWWELNAGNPEADEDGGPPGSSSEFSPNVSVLSELVVDRADDTTYGQCDPLIPADCSLRGALAVASQGVTIYFDQQVFDANQETVIQLSQPLPPITTPNIQLLGTAHPDADWWQAVSVTLDGSQIPAGP